MTASWQRFCKAHPARPRYADALETGAPLRQRLGAEIHGAIEEQVEDEEGQVAPAAADLAAAHGRTQRGEVGRSLAIEHAELAVEHCGPEGGGVACEIGQARGPVIAVAGVPRRATPADAELHAVAVQLDLVAPALACRRTGHHAGVLQR